MEIKKRDVLIAIDECFMTFEQVPALIVGKEYKINNVSGTNISVTSEVNELHWFTIKDIQKYFKLKYEFEAPKHYDNSKGTLYKVAEERGWNTYLFDIVKRLERANKKGEFESDLNKSKLVIDLWLQENKK